MLHLDRLVQFFAEAKHPVDTMGYNEAMGFLADCRRELDAARNIVHDYEQGVAIDVKHLNALRGPVA